MTEEEFLMWRDQPVTQALFRALSNKAEEAKSRWLSASWDGGRVDAELLADLRATADICNDILDMTFEELEAAIGNDAHS